MQEALEGITLTKLIEKIDANLTYGGARKISEFESKLLDQIDENYDAQIKMQKNLEFAKQETEKTQKKLKETDDAIIMYCSATTRDKILLERGWQFMPEKAEEIKKALSDKEILEQVHNGGITVESVIKNAIIKGSTLQDVENADYVEKNEKSKDEIKLEGETKDD
jgi:hypothetical protein